MAYYNYDRICSYNACFNFILTNRGYGKSYGAKKRAITRFKKYGEGIRKKKKLHGRPIKQDRWSFYN